MCSESIVRRPLRVRHLLAEIEGAPAALLRSRRRLGRLLERSLDAAGFHRLGLAAGHSFRAGGRGVTLVVLLSESHAAIHTYPEIGYAALDILACGTADPAAASRHFARELGAARVRMRIVRRALPGRAGAKPALPMRKGLPGAGRHL